MTEPSTTYMAPRDVGRRLGITTSGVIALVGRGQLRDIRDSAGRRFFDPVEVERCARERAARNAPLAVEAR
jgi:hypothetical protein